MILRNEKNWDIKLELVKDESFNKTGDIKIDTEDKNAMYYHFYTNLEITVEEISKCFLLAFGDHQELSFKRTEGHKSFDELYKGLKNLDN